MSILIIIGYLGIALHLAVFAIKKGIKTWSVNLFASIFILIFYCLVPLLCLVLYDSTTTEIGGYRLPEQSGLLSLECLFTIFIGVLTYTTIYSATTSKRNKKVCYKLINLKSNGLNVTLIAAYFIISLSTISCIVYIRGFGSFEEAVKMADIVRSGAYSMENKDASFLFFKRFIQLSLIPLLFYPLTHPKKLFSRILYIAIPCINLFIFYFYLDNSRQGLVMLFLIPIFAHLIKVKKLKIGLLFILLIVTLLISPLLDAFFTTREFVNAHQKNLLDTVLGELGFPFFSIQASYNYDAPLNWFSDFYTGIFGSFLPTSLGPKIEGSDYYNSIALGMVENTVPPGLLAQGLYAFRIFGVIFIAAFTGWLFAKLDNFFGNHPYGTKYIYAFAILDSLTWIRTGTPRLYLYHPLNVSVLLFVWLLYKRLIVIKPISLVSRKN